MKIVVAVNLKDFRQAGLMLGRLFNLAALKDREVIIACCWDDKFDVDPLYQQFQRVYPNTRLYVLPDVPGAAEWPEAPNHMFYQTCVNLVRNGNQEPFYFMEPDNFPLYPDCLDELEQEYTEAGQPYMGAKNLSRFLEGDETVIRGEHMVGTGIYPANFLEICNGVHELTDIPWDVALQDEILPSCHVTEKIHHAWCTGGYHYEGDQLIAEPRNPFKRYGGPVKDTAVMIHGCKDDSLYKLTLRPRPLPS